MLSQGIGHITYKMYYMLNKMMSRLQAQTHNGLAIRFMVE